MDWKKRFKKDKLQIRVIKEWTHDEQHPTAGVLIYVENGKGILKETVGVYDEKGFATLTFHDMPLLQFHGDEYFCPTCEKFIRSGYQLEQDFYEIKGINDSKDEVSLQEAITNLFPLWGLLPSGYYIIHDTELYPTDGNGNLFWNFSNETNYQLGSCPVYFGNGRYGFGYPKYTIATQSRALCREERVAYYQEHRNARAIAYYMEGYYCALLDGHHKMMAAAKNHTLCNALVVERCSFAYNSEFYYLNSTLVSNSNLAEFKISKKEYDAISRQQIYKITPEETQWMNIAIERNQSQPPLLKWDMKDRVCYPSIEQEAAKEYLGTNYINIVDDICNRKDVSHYDDFDIFIKALPSLFSYEECKKIGKLLCACNYPNAVTFDILKMLVKLPRDEELEQLFIDMYIAYDDCSYIKELLGKNL